MLRSAFFTVLLSAYAHAHAHHGAASAVACDSSSTVPSEPWSAKYAGSPDLSFSGITTFARLNHSRCLDEPGGALDIAFLGFPFDTAVSYRTGARFGPNAIRQASRRMATNRGYSISANFNPFLAGADILDCGDVPVSPYDNALAFDQMERAYTTLLQRPVKTAWMEEHGRTKTVSLDGREHPIILAAGGDHSIVLPALRSLGKVYGNVSVIHLDAHLDSWKGSAYRGAWTKQSEITHGSFFHKAGEEGLIRDNSVHLGIRTRLSDFDDLIEDRQVGFRAFTTNDIDLIGPDGIVEAVKHIVGDGPVYLSLDIDVLDPSMAPGTGTPETGGWTTREVKRILRGFSSLNVVGADVVEVSPAYDTNADLTALAAADVFQEFLAILLKEKTLPPVANGQEKKWKPAVSQGVLYDEREKKAEQKEVKHEEL
ncbi:hypothetical protein JCM8547_007142 [Rhodosporidiobolus lusitaniae]